MIARAPIPKEYLQWNAAHGAPFGRDDRWLRQFPFAFLPEAYRRRYAGPFAIQTNNTTRSYEYPWAAHEASLSPGMNVLEIGGGLSGFQFVLSRMGCSVVNVDPGLEAVGKGWPCDSDSMTRMNRLYGTSVKLHNTVISQANLEPESFDRIFSISVLEHLPEREIAEAVSAAYELLKPGGYFVLTVDLFLDLVPFTSRTKNRYGTNVSVKSIVEYAPFGIEKGDERELYGYPNFNHDDVQGRLADFIVGAGYPSLIQCLVLRK